MDYISVISDDVDLSHEHRYLRLPHPRTGQPQLYLPVKSHSTPSRDVLLEVVKVNCARRRTWFIGDSKIDAGTILVQHEVDPLFLVIPIVLHLLKSPNANSFQPLDDLVSTAASSSLFSLTAPFTRPPAGPDKTASSSRSGVNEDLSRLLAIRSVRKAFRLCCERKVIPMAPATPPSEGQSSSSSPLQVAGPVQKYYRPSLDRVIALVQRKVAHLSDPEQFEQFDHFVRGLGRDGLVSSSSSSAAASSAGQQELVKAARIKASLDTIAQYLPPQVLPDLTKTYDFEALGIYLQNRSAAAAAAAAPIVNGSSNKDKAGAAGAAAAKRKAQAGSRGVESLKMANTTGMAKMTSFFKKK